MNNTKRNHGKEEDRDEGQKEYIFFMQNVNAKLSISPAKKT